jgi:hypothetical protein
MSFRTRKGKLKHKLSVELSKEQPDIRNILKFVDQYEKDNLNTIDKLSRKKKVILNKINGALKQCINAHGPIDKTFINSASKRIYGSILDVESEDKRYSIRDILIGVTIATIIILIIM